MSLKLADNTVTVWKVEDKGNYSVVQFSSSRKDKKTETWVNSSWSFVNFVGEAHKKAKELNPKDKIVLKGAVLGNEPYLKDGVKTYPKNPRMTVFNFEKEGERTEPEESPEEGFPF